MALSRGLVYAFKQQWMHLTIYIWNSTCYKHRGSASEGNKRSDTHTNLCRFYVILLMTFYCAFRQPKQQIQCVEMGSPALQSVFFLNFPSWVEFRVWGWLKSRKKGNDRWMDGKMIKFDLGWNNRLTQSSITRKKHSDT